MHLELDHVFILVELGAAVADLLLDQGFLEGTGNQHPGQGTSNRRFYFANGMLEFLWVHDAAEAKNGPGQQLRFPERVQIPTASPFGMIFLKTDDANPVMPFEGWTYQPDYFVPPNAFHVGANSSCLAEPLCFCAPLIKPRASRSKPEHTNAQFISRVCLYIPSNDLSGVMKRVSQVDRLSIKQGNEHLMEITLDSHESIEAKDFRPDIPLIIKPGALKH